MQLYPGFVQVRNFDISVDFSLPFFFLHLHPIHQKLPGDTHASYHIHHNHLGLIAIQPQPPSGFNPCPLSTLLNSKAMMILWNMLDLVMQMFQIIQIHISLSMQSQSPNEAYQAPKLFSISLPRPHPPLLPSWPLPCWSSNEPGKLLTRGMCSGYSICLNRLHTSYSYGPSSSFLLRFSEIFPNLPSQNRTLL